MRTDITIPSGDDTLAAWLYLPERTRGRKPPVIVMGHGLGAVKEVLFDAGQVQLASDGTWSLLYDLEAIAECLERLSQLALDFPSIHELDINPLVVFGKGQGAGVIDARIFIG